MILKLRNLALNWGGSVCRRISKTFCCSVYIYIYIYIFDVGSECKYGQLRMFYKVSPTALQTPPHWKVISRSKPIALPVLSPSRILPSGSCCAVIITRKNSDSLFKNFANSAFLIKKDCVILKLRNLTLNWGGSVFRRISKTFCCSVYCLIKWQRTTNDQRSRLVMWLLGADAPTVVEGCLVRLEVTCACNVYHAWLRLLLKWQVLNLNTAIVWSGARLCGLSVHRFHVLTVQHVTWFSLYL